MLIATILRRKSQVRPALGRRTLTLAALLFVLVMQTGASAFACALSFGGGEGTSDYPFKISTTDHLVSLRGAWMGNETCITGGRHYLQMATLDFSGLPSWSDGIGGVNSDSSWNTVNDLLFSGVYDGGGHAIIGLAIGAEGSPNNFSALFAGALNATIRNLSITDALIDGNRYVGVLLGRGQNVSLTDVTISGQVTSYVVNNNSDAGVVAGRLDDSWLERVTVTYPSSVSGSYNVGGIVGYTRDTTMVSVANAGDVSATDRYTGGLAGYAKDVTITDATVANGASPVNVTSLGDYVGGLVGYADGVSVLGKSHGFRFGRGFRRWGPCRKV